MELITDINVSHLTEKMHLDKIEMLKRMILIYEAEIKEIGSSTDSYLKSIVRENKALIDECNIELSQLTNLVKTTNW